ncbi:hypothetical protein LOZ66_006092 [Ophidiomyces ophidiicola]|nr:hypothetical protein LOZ66_006092 [Ophidiomyces ophidiicola]
MVTSVQLTEPAAGNPDPPDTCNSTCEVGQLSCQSVPGKSGVGTSTLGNLDILPLEVLRLALSDMDLQSLTNFSQTCRYAKTVVDGLLNYKTLCTLVPGVVKSIVALGAGNWISCDILQDMLRNATCVACGEFGPFIYLFSCERVCADCFVLAAEYPTGFVKFAYSVCGLNDEAVGDLRTLRILEDNVCSTAVHDTLRLINRKDAVTTGLQLRTAPFRFLDILSGGTAELEELSSSESESSVTHNKKSDVISALIFYAGALRAPKIDFDSRAVEWGTCCEICDQEGRIGKAKMDWDHCSEESSECIMECDGARKILSCMDYCQLIVRNAVGGYIKFND